MRISAACSGVLPLYVIEAWSSGAAHASGARARHKRTSGAAANASAPRAARDGDAPTPAMHLSLIHISEPTRRS
eukprot:3418772-Prymnesium_polylepis.2